MGLERMLRMYFVQQWYGLADEAVEDAVYDSQALRNFMGIDLSRTSVPDATTVMGFRHLLEAHDLTKAMLVEYSLRSQRHADGARPLDDARHAGGCHLDCGTEFNEKQRACTGSRNAPGQKRQAVAHDRRAS